MEPVGETSLFNSDLEAGIRAIAILTAFFPLSLELRQMSLYDYFIVHTGDIGGPSSLHPKISSRTGEFFIRRRTVENGLSMMIKAGLVKEKYESAGVVYSVTEFSSAMAGLVKASYNRRLFHCADWLASQSRASVGGEFENSLLERIDRWSLDLGFGDFGDEAQA